MPAHTTLTHWWLTVLALAALTRCSFRSGNGTAQATTPSVEVKDAPVVYFRGANSPSLQEPGETHCNSPAHLDQDTLYSFNSAGHPWRSAGSDLFGLKNNYRRVDASKQETDKLAGQRARLFVLGKSLWELIFHAPANGR